MKMKNKNGPQFEKQMLQTPIIIIDDLVKIYKQGKVELTALRGIKATFHPGVTVIMGPSGSGKSTLLNMIGGIDKPSAGKVLINQIDITKLKNSELDKFRRENIGFVFQTFNLIPIFSGEENIRIPMMFSGFPKNKQDARVKELLSLFNIEDRSNHKPEELSGGEQQRFAIASALSNNPQIILCDEPTGELDSKSRDDYMEAMKDLIHKYPDKIIIIITHDPSFSKIANKMYHIHDGLISDEFHEEQLKVRFKDEESKVDSKFKEKYYNLKTEIEKLWKKVQKEPLQIEEKNEEDKRFKKARSKSEENHLKT